MQTDQQTGGLGDRGIVQVQRQTAVRAVTVMLIAMATWNGTGRAMGECDMEWGLGIEAWVCDMSPAFSTKLVPIFPERSVKLSLSECQIHYNNRATSAGARAHVMLTARQWQKEEAEKLWRGDKKINWELAGKFGKLQAAALCQNDKLQGVNLALISLGNLNLHIFPKGRIYDNLRFICGKAVNIG